MSRRLPSLLAVLFCWLLAGGAVVTAVGAFRFLKVAQPVTGRVIALREHAGEDGATYSPTIEFTDQSGRTHVLESTHSSSPPGFQIGEAVTVLCPPGRPEDGKLNHPLDLWGIPVALGALAVGCGVFGAVLRARNRTGVC